MSSKTRETSLAEKVIKYLDTLQEEGLPLFYEHRSGSGGYNYKKGIPDLYLVINGIHIECELKTEEGKLSTMQEKFRWRCKSEWKMDYVCPRSLEEFKTFLDPYIKKILLETNKNQ